MAKLPVILGNLDVTVDSVAPDLSSKAFILTSISECSERHMLSVWSGSGLVDSSVCVCVCRLCHALLSSSASD